jgi:hypothetical protein
MEDGEEVYGQQQQGRTAADEDDDIAKQVQLQLQRHRSKRMKRTSYREDEELFEDSD